MAKPRLRRHFDRALFVVLIIVGAIGCALWDVSAVEDAIAAGKLVPAPGNVVPVAPASPASALPLPLPLPLPVPGVSWTAVLAALRG